MTRWTDFELCFERDTAVEALAHETNRVKLRYWIARYQRVDAKLRGRLWTYQHPQLKS